MAFSMYSIGIPLIDLITFGTLEYYVKPPTPKKTKKKPHKQKMTRNRVIKSRQKKN